MSLTWERLNPDERLLAARVDIYDHISASVLAGCMSVGECRIDPAMDTAATDGVNIYVGQALARQCSRKQLRYVLLHEAMHVALKHCVSYKDIVEKYPDESNCAMDYVVNLAVEALDTNRDFVERPPCGVLIDQQYAGMSFIEVLQALVRKRNQCQPDRQQQPTDHPQGKGQSSPQPFDQHIQAERTPDAQAEVEQQVDDAKLRGEVLQRNAAKRAGVESPGEKIDLTVEDRHTDWRAALRRFLDEVTEGDEYSRYAPRNRIMAAQDVCLPSHFSESIGEIVVACDTSGSMASVYPTLFGELARICETTDPERVRVLWWDTKVQSEQLFKRGEYGRIKALLAPRGGGGTSPGCIAAHLASTKSQAPKAVLILTDGYLDGSYAPLKVPVLWGVVNHRSFRAPQGAVVHINH